MTTAVLHRWPCCDTSFCSQHPRQCALVSGILCLVLGETAFPSAAEHPGVFPALQFCWSVCTCEGLYLSTCAALCNGEEDAVVFCDVVCSLSFKYILLKLPPELSCCRVTAVNQAKDSPVRAGVCAWDRKSQGVLPQTWCNGSFVQANVATVKKEKAKVLAEFSILEQINCSLWSTRQCSLRQGSACRNEGLC